MNKPNPIQITIPHPCTQNWEHMMPEDNGRHCEHCAKTVIDFTTWSDAALYTYFSKDTGHTCGRFLASQLDRPIHIPHQPYSRLYRMTIALGLTLLFTQTPHLLAQTKPPVTLPNTTDRMNKSAHLLNAKEVKDSVAIKRGAKKLLVNHEETVITGEYSPIRTQDVSELNRDRKAIPIADSVVSGVSKNIHPKEVITAPNKRVFTREEINHRP